VSGARVETDRTGVVQAGARGASGVRRRFAAVVIGLLLLAMAGLVGRLVDLQLGGGDRALAYALPRRVSTVPVMARRGMVLDVRGRILAGSRLTNTVFADPWLLAEPSDGDDWPSAELIRSLSEILQQEPGELRAQITANPSKRFVTLARQVDDSAAERVRELRVFGVGVISEPVREYPMGSLFAHGLGFVGREGKGLEGLEAALDDVLTGHDGHKTVIKDASQRHLWLDEDGGFEPPVDGHDVVLSIDAVVQEIAERHLGEAVAQFEAPAGSLLVMDPRTGELLALANWPTFDPNNFQQADADARRDRAITDPVEPGSIFKPFVAATALKEKVVNTEELIFCHNGLAVFGKRMLHDVHPYGQLTFKEIVAKSSNIGMAQLGLRLGNARIEPTLRAFGFGSPTGIELPGESGGILLPLNTWTSYSTTSLPMGQEISVTPLQVITAFSAIVNGGTLMRPRVVRGIVSADGEVIEDRSQPIVRRQVLDAKTADYMRDVVLTAVVNEGTGKRVQLDEYQVCGKTGTAQVARKDGKGYEPGAYTSSFVGAAPASDPRVAVLCMIYRPNASKGYYGSTVSGPAVREVIRETLAYLRVPPDRTEPPATASR
jgi:cell division protein FtsI/penicillin-binding protein 2